MPGGPLHSIMLRLKTFAATRDPNVVLAHDALVDAAEVLGAALSVPVAGARPPRGINVQAVAAVAWLHVYRHDVLATHRQQPDSDAALWLFAFLFPVAPEAIPPAIIRGVGMDTMPPIDHITAWNSHAVVLFATWQHTGHLGVLRAAIETWQAIVAAAPVTHPDRPGWLANLGTALLDQFERTDDQHALVAAVDASRSAVEAAQPGHSNFTLCLNSLGNALQRRFGRTGALADLSEAIDVRRAALEATPTGHPNRAKYLCNLGTALQRRYERTGDRPDVDAAIDMLQAAVDTTPHDHPDRAPYLTNLSSALGVRCERTGVRADLDAAVDASRAAVVLTPDGHPARADRLDGLGQALLRRFGRTGDVADLNAAVETLHAAVEAAPGDRPHRGRLLNSLGRALQKRFERIGELVDLDAAVDALRTAVDTIPSDHPDHAVTLTNLGGALQRRFERTDVMADLEAAIDAGRAAVDATPIDHANLARRLSLLAGALQNRFDRTGSLADLDAAITALRTAAPETPTSATHLSNLGLTLQQRFERTGQVADIDAAVDAEQAAVEATPDDHPDRGVYLSNLGLSLQRRFEHTGQMADIDAAVDAGRAAVETTPGDHPRHAMSLGNLGGALCRRYQRTGVLADLDAAVDALKASVDATPANDPKRAGRLSDLCGGLNLRFIRAGSSADAQAAIEAGRAAVDATPEDHPSRAQHLVNLCGSLQLRFLRSRTAEDVHAAIEVARAAVDSTPGDHPERPQRLFMLGISLHRQFESTGATADLVAAIAILEAAAETTPPDHHERAQLLHTLGLALRNRFRRDGDAPTGDRARRLLREVSASTVSSASTRVHAAKAWGELAAEFADWPDALAAYSLAIQQLQVSAWHGLDHTDQLYALRLTAGLAADAAGVALNADQPEQAIVLLEQGRGVLLAHSLRVRSDRTQLHERAPDLAARMDQIRRQLDTPVTGVPTPPMAELWKTSLAGHRTAQQRQALSREWDDLVSQARRLPGFAGFLRPPAFADLHLAAGEGPVVIVNTSRYRCDALIATRDGLRVLPLRDITIEVVTEKTMTLLRALADAQASLSSRWQVQRVLNETLEWLWDTMVEPVLDPLGFLGDTDPAALPRLWWCPTGVSAFLPLHAAGRHATPSRDTVLDRVVCSYTPTLNALVAARTRQTAVDGRMLAVTLPVTADLPDLPQADHELALLRRHLPDCTVLAGPNATRHSVLAELPGHAWLHFAGHGRQNAFDPTSAALHVHDHQSRPITITDIAGLRLVDAQLAFLSACETARGSTEFPDESMHIAGALQLAGFTHVIATQWTISDTLAPLIADHVYGHLTGDAPLDPRHTAVALHSAIRSLRDAHPPVAWAAYVHSGP